MKIKKVALVVLLCLMFSDVIAQDSTALKITGLYLGAPSDFEDADKGGVSGIVGLRYLTLDYRKSFNYFATLALSTDTFTSSEDRDAAREVSDIDSNLEVVESLFSGFVVSAGFTYNTNFLDNVVFYAGPEVMFGDTIITLPNESFISLSDERIGLLGGLMMGFEQFFASVDFSTNTESLRLAVGYGF